MDIQFIPNDPETILADTIAVYQQKYGMQLNPADPERIMIDVMAYRENLLRGKMEFLMRQNFVRYATAPALDNWGELFGITRNEGESDDDYRLRILNSTHSAIGTKEAYRQRIMALPFISDILITRKCEDATLPPGVIRLTPLVKDENSGTIFGTAHSEEDETAILESIEADNFGVIGATFVFEKAQKVILSGSVSVRSVLGFDTSLLRTNVERKINEYFASLSLTFDATFGEYDLERAILSADGVLSVSNISFPNVPVKRAGEYFVKGEISVEYN